MARYRIFLSDALDYVQEAISLDCCNDQEAMVYARTLIKPHGHVDLWNSNTIGPLIGSLTLHPGILCSALVKRCFKATVT